MTTLNRRAALKSLVKGVIGISATLLGLNVSHEQIEAVRQAYLSDVFIDIHNELSTPA